MAFFSGNTSKFLCWLVGILGVYDHCITFRVDEKRNVCYTSTNPVGIRSLSNCSLQDILFVDAFEKRFERLDIRHQAWFIKVSTAQLQIVFKAARNSMSQDEAV